MGGNTIEVKQNGSHNTPLRYLGRDQLSPLRVLLPIIQLKYTSLSGLVILIMLCIGLPSSPSIVYASNLGSQYIFRSQNVVFESRVTFQPYLRVFPIFI
jgi:hypothetical protein